MSRVDILGVGIDSVLAPEALVRLRQGLQDGQRQFVVTVNPETVMRAHRDLAYKQLLAGASLSVADGAGIVWASAYLAKPLRGLFKKFRAYTQGIWLLLLLLIWPRRVQHVMPGTVTGSDLTVDLAGMCEEFGYRLYVLGAGEGVAEQAAVELKQRFPRLEIAGTESGSPHAGSDAETRKRITESRAQVVLVAFGQPKQEQWIVRNLQKLPSPVLAIGVGGTLDYLAGAASVEGGGAAKPPPAVVRRRGLEWLWRLFSQPSRWRRIVTALPVFVMTVIRFKRDRHRTA